jgi:ATP-dependent Zn protease
MSMRPIENARLISDAVSDSVIEEFLTESDEPENPPPPPPRDRAEIAAIYLLRRFADLQPEKFDKPELVIIEVPREIWVPPVAEAVPIVLFGSDKQRDSKFAHRTRRDLDAPYYVFQSADVRNVKPSDSIFDQIVEGLLKGKTIVIVVHSNDELMSSQILGTVDRRLILPELNAEWFNGFLVEATGNEPLKDWAEIKFENLTPSILRLAVRAGQSADDYAHRIARLARQGQQKEKTEKKPERKLRLSDLHGMTEAVDWAKSLAADIAEYQAGRLPWADCDRGALFHGPSGSGKTTIARAIADHCNLPFFATSYADWQAQGTGHLGDVTKAIRAVFSKARAAAPSIIFIDELDTVNSRGGSKRHDDWWTSIINILLEVLDGSGDREGVVVIGATNYPDKIDPAIRRSGRLDREIRIGLPDASALTEIYRFHLENLLPEADLGRLANLSVGRSGADVARFARGARRRARVARRGVNFEDVFFEITGGLSEDGNKVMRRVAIHEAAHAVALILLKPGSLSSISIGSDGSLGGKTVSMTDKYSELTGTEIDNALVILFAGRAAEEIVFGRPSAGAGGHADSDLAKATWLASAAEFYFGLGSTGLVWFDLPGPEDLHTILTMRPDAQLAIRGRLDAAYAKAKALVEESRTIIEGIGEALLTRIVLTSDEVSNIMGKTSKKDDAAHAPERRGDGLDPAQIGCA